MYLASYYNQECVLLGASYRLCTTLCDVGDSEVEIRTASGLNMTLYPVLGISSGT